MSEVTPKGKNVKNEFIVYLSLLVISGTRLLGEEMATFAHHSSSDLVGYVMCNNISISLYSDTMCSVYVTA